MYIWSMGHAENCEKRINSIREKHPEIKQVIDEVLRIYNMPNHEFDYMVERTDLMYREVQRILYPQE